MKRFLILLVLSASLAGCKDWLDVNTDKSNPVDVPMSMLLPTIELNAAASLSAATGIGQDLGVYTHQLSTREEANIYGADGNEYYLVESWTSMYNTTMQNLEKVLVKAEAEEAPHYSGIAKIIKAYMFSQFVDIFGEVPFSEANQKDNGILYPKFDKGEDIYPELFKLLDEGIADLKKAKGGIYPGTDDLIFAGNATNWIKTANTIKLKLYNQIRLVDNTVGPKITALLANNAELISSTATGFMFPYTAKRTPDERNPAYTETYEATQKSTHMSPWFYEILRGINPLFSGITDPRIPYYFYKQLNSTQTGKDGNTFEYRYGGFTTIYFGSNGPDRDRSQDKSISVYGIYPCGGRYDIDDALTVGAESGTGAAPYRFLTYADRLFIEAELISAGVITGDARAKLNAAMVEAFKLVDYVVTKAKGTQTVPVLSGATATTYINKILALYDAGDANKKMEIIMTQKWISSFGSYVDQYTDYRRTGYPVLFDPNNPTMAPGGYVTPPAGGDPDRTLPPVKVSCSLNYPLSLAWPNEELNKNPNAPAQKTDPSTFKVFWDK
jgi:hypothetical protein